MDEAMGTERHLMQGVELKAMGAVEFWGRMEGLHETFGTDELHLIHLREKLTGDTLKWAVQLIGRYAAACP